MSEKPNHFVASRRRWLESQGRDGARQENGQNEWYDLEYQGAKAEAPPCPKQHPADSPAKAKLVVGLRRRRSLGSDGRQAKAKDCFREPGQGNAEIL